MTSAEITRELRAARPVAPTALRARVLEGAAREAVPVPSLLDRLRGRRLLVAVPLAASLAIAAAVAIGVTRPETGRDASTAPPGTVASESSAGGAGDALQGTPTLPSAKAGTTAAQDRAQRITAFLSLRVADGDALSTATRDAIRITRTLGGYVIRSDVSAGDDGAATISVRIPTARAQDAIAQLSELGAIAAQRVQAEDLQGSLDTLEADLVRLRTRLAAVRARLASDDLTPTERAALQVRRDQLVAQLVATRGQRDATRAEAAEASIDLELRTEQSSGVAPVPSRLDRTLTRALDVLAWEAVTVLGLLVVLAPLAVAGLAVLVARRWTRRRDDDRLLGVA